MQSSDYLTPGRILGGKIGVNAVNNSDLLLMNSLGQLYTAQVTDFAAVANIGSTVIAQTTVNTTASATFTNNKHAIYSAMDGATFIVTANATPNANAKIYKYTSSGSLAASLQIDSAGGNLSYPTIVQLSNNNIAVVWICGAASATLQFIILDRSLNVLTAAVTLSTAATFCDAIALSGGGFSIAYAAGSGMVQAIYSNTGSVVSASTAISGSPTTNPSGIQIQLSNGNIMMAIASSTSSKALGFAINTIAGAQVSAYTGLNTGTNSGLTIPRISAMASGSPSAGFVAIEGISGTTYNLYVLNNAGTQQGTTFTVASGTTNTDWLTNDGTLFWGCLNTGSGAFIYSIPITGGAGVISTTSVSSSSSAIFVDKGLIILVGSSPAIGVYQPSAVSTPSVVNLVASSNPATPSSNATGALYATVTPDFSILLASEINSTGAIFVNLKYMTAVIMGVSQQTFSAGNSGTATTLNHGGGSGKNAFPSNQMIGTVGKSFDHSASAIIGNKGTMYLNGCVLEGIA